MKYLTEAQAGIRVQEAKRPAPRNIQTSVQHAVTSAASTLQTNTTYDTISTSVTIAAIPTRRLTFSGNFQYCISHPVAQDSD